MNFFKTLIVEDNATFRQLLIDTLSTQFPRMFIEEAKDGEEAIQKTDRLTPHLIFMDIKLPGENGLVLTRKIKAKHPEILVAILTSYSLPEYREAAIKNGASYFIIKGAFTNEEIITLVKSILSDQGFQLNGHTE